jgi:hypothetical protein
VTDDPYIASTARVRPSASTTTNCSATIRSPCRGGAITCFMIDTIGSANTACENMLPDIPPKMDDATYFAPLLQHLQTPGISAGFVYDNLYKQYRQTLDGYVRTGRIDPIASQSYDQPDYLTTGGQGTVQALKQIFGQ